MKINEAVSLFVKGLFQQADQILLDEKYRGLKDADYFYTKASGVTFENRQELIKEIKDGEQIQLVREPENIHDPNAIKVMDLRGNHLGYLNAQMVKHLAPEFDKGVEYRCTVSAVTGRDKETLGLNLYIEKKDYVEDQALLEGMKVREELEQLKPTDLMDKIREFLLDGHNYRPKQEESLDKLFWGKNLLTIMGTGRGKSAIFQSFAAYHAILNKHITIIVYPLRALANDQYDALKRKLTPIGIRVMKANGSLSEHERERFRNALSTGEVDLILTTPEFLEFHLDRFKKIKHRIKFFVADEAHHIGVDSAAFRPAYQNLGKCLEGLGNPQVLAVTATATDEVADMITSTLGIKDVVVDPSVRENLKLRDVRNRYKRPPKYMVVENWPMKEDYLTALIRTGDKIIIFTNSRAKTVEVAQELVERVPEMADQICFYNAGLTPKERQQIEDYFRSGEIKVLVSTSAFGEGADIPDIRYVVHYHMNFNWLDFNQQSGRAGRNGDDAEIIMMFGEDDKRLNEFILDASTPDRDYMVDVYKWLHSLGGITTQNDEMLSENLKMKMEESLNADNGPDDKPSKYLTSTQRMSAALAIFEELGIVEITREGRERTVKLVPTRKSFSLNNSATYAEGLREKCEFELFSNAILTQDNLTLIERINRPIYPKKYVKEEKAVS